MKKHPLVLAGIVSFVLAGIIGAPNTSALDDFPIVNDAHEAPSIPAPLQPYAFNPFGDDRETTNRGSSINRNESSFPTYLYNVTSGPQLYGHDGKGIAFADTKNLVDGSPQHKVAQRGETLNYSVEVNTVRYYDEEETVPVETYIVSASFSEGLSMDLDSVVVKVDGQTLNEEQYQLESQDYAEITTSDDELRSASMYYGGAVSLLYVRLPFMENEAFLYNEGAKVTVEYSATVNQDAPSEVFSRAVFATNVDGSSALNLGFHSHEHQATASLDGNIVIRRVDENGQPVSGAKYTVDGVTANKKDGTKNVYTYAQNGAVSVFETDVNGEVFIEGLDFGKYTVREVSSPDGHAPVQDSISQTLTTNLKEVDMGRTSFYFASSYSGFGVTYDGVMETLENGDKYVPAKFGDPSTYNLNYDSNTGRYGTDYMNVTKTGTGYHVNASNNLIQKDLVYDNALGKYVALVTLYDTISGGPEQLPSSMFSFRIIDGVPMIEFNGETAPYEYHSDYDCYGFPGGLNTSVSCIYEKDGEYIMADISPVDGFPIYVYPYTYDEASGKYVFADYKYYYLILDEIDDSRAILSYNPVLNYNSTFDTYHGQFLRGNTVLNKVNVPDAASEFLFRSKTDTPEGIANPQTTDTLLGTIAVIVMSIASIAFTKNRLQKR